jgi:hypothetical protein
MRDPRKWAWGKGAAAGELEDAWDALLAVVPAGWYVGQPSHHPERNEWVLYAYDPSERPKRGVRSHERTATASTEEGVVREMARCLRDIADGRPPR